MTDEQMREKARELAKYFDWDEDSEQVREIYLLLRDANDAALDSAAEEAKGACGKLCGCYEAISALKGGDK